jgi:hypothetical protein
MVDVNVCACSTVTAAAAPPAAVPPPRRAGGAVSHPFGPIHRLPSGSGLNHALPCTRYLPMKKRITVPHQVPIKKNPLNLVRPMTRPALVHRHPPCPRNGGGPRMNDMTFWIPADPWPRISRPLIPISLKSIIKCMRPVPGTVTMPCSRHRSGPPSLTQHPPTQVVIVSVAQTLQLLPSLSP